MKMSSEKKKIFGVILSFLLVFSMSVPVMAEDENIRQNRLALINSIEENIQKILKIENIVE